jgi:hypothetical protein
LVLQNSAKKESVLENDLITISYDPSTGKLEFSAPKDQLEKASDAAQVLIKTAHACLLPTSRSAPEQDVHPTATATPAPPKPAPTRSTKRPGDSSGRTGRIGSFEKVDFAISEDQERAIHEFYMARRPAEQRQQVAIAMYIGAKVICRPAFEYNEIYTLLHLGGERELPKALDVVIGQLSKENWVVKEGRGFALKFLARDYVEKLNVEST